MGASVLKGAHPPPAIQMMRPGPWLPPAAIQMTRSGPQHPPPAVQMMRPRTGHPPPAMQMMSPGQPHRLTGPGSGFICPHQKSRSERLPLPSTAGLFRCCAPDGQNRSRARKRQDLPGIWACVKHGLPRPRARKKQGLPRPRARVKQMKQKLKQLCPQMTVRRGTTWFN